MAARTRSKCAAIWSATSFAESNAEGKSTGFALLSAVRVKGVAVAAGADPTVLDRFCRNSGPPELALICRPQIEVRAAVTLQDYGVEPVGAKGSQHLGINRVAAGSDRRSDSNHEVGWVGAKCSSNGADNGPRNPTRCASPASVRRANDPTPSIAEGQRHTVGERKKKVQAWNIANHPITGELHLAP
jgi:hypothetical protein